MPFYCRQCNTQKSLKVVRNLEIYRDARSDEITLQLVRCAECRATGILVYEESRRGALDSESWSHTGYWVDEQQWKVVEKEISGCSDPRNPRCTCPAHQKYGGRDAGGRWDGLKHIPVKGQYTVVG